MDNKDEIRVWGIHTRDDNLFLQNDLIGLGWEEMGDIGKIEKTREAFKSEYAKVYKDATKGSIATNAGQLYRFVCEMRCGDYIVFPSKIDRKINIGKIESEYYYEADAKRYNKRRRVKWLKHFPRTDFSQDALYEVGAAQTFFSINNNTDEFLTALSGKKSGAGEINIGVTAEDIDQITKDFVLKSLRKNLKGYPLESFVANLLEAMGYHAVVSPQGGDNGYDITAYKDELPPRILVQVKSQAKDVNEATVQSFRGAMKPGDYGLFVTLSDFMPNAKEFLKQNPIIKGLNGYDLVDLVIKYYDKLDEHYQNYIPLKMVYIPVVNSDEDTPSSVVE